MRTNTFCETLSTEFAQLSESTRRWIAALVIGLAVGAPMGYFEQQTNGLDTAKTAVSHAAESVSADVVTALR